MKKTILVLLSALFSFILISCGGSATVKKEKKDPKLYNQYDKEDIKAMQDAEKMNVE